MALAPIFIIWFGYEVAEQLRLLEDWSRSRFFDEAARHMAIGMLTALRAEQELGRA